MIWWHKWRKHTVEECRVSVPMWDISAKGILYKCSCGKDWAK
jgi:hypothetical protein